MTESASLLGGFAETDMHHVLQRACDAVGLDSSVSEVLRAHTNAVVLLKRTPVVVKIARRGTRPERVADTVGFVRWLMARGFPTVPLHGTAAQPVVIDGHPVTFWTYLPQPHHPVAPEQLAQLLSELHNLPQPPGALPRLSNLSAIRSSLTHVSSLPENSLQYLSERADQLELALTSVGYTFRVTVVQGDPQHRNALHQGDQAVLCDWDTVAYGQPEWDLTTIEIHCRRFGHGVEHYRRFAETYGFDVTTWSGYPVLRDIRELRMITTNARKASHSPGTLQEVEKRIAGLRSGDTEQRWNIL